jgi:ribulose-phosphate 3-epimerase
MKITDAPSYQLSASLICANMLELKDTVQQIDSSGCNNIHYDVMDGVFVPRYGLYPELLSSVKAITSLPIYVHMMTVEPEKYIQTFVDAGADCISVHAEACVHLHRVINLIKSQGIKAGIVLNVATSLSVLDYVLDEIDLIMLMAINPGIVGHKIIPCIYSKIKDCREKLVKKGISEKVTVEIDGGVTMESAPLMLTAGANMLVCGSSTIFKSDRTISECVCSLRNEINNKKSLNNEL